MTLLLFHLRPQGDSKDLVPALDENLLNLQKKEKERENT